MANPIETCKQAMDKRVKAFAPISFDALNLQLQLDRHWAAYGGSYAPALQDYTDLNIFCRARATPAGVVSSGRSNCAWPWERPHASRR